MNLRDRAVFLSITLVLLAVATGLIWQSRFPPMQDYPQHLMQFHILETFQDPRYNWQKHFETNLNVAPYSASYLLSALFSRFMGIESVGKAILTVYLALIAVFVGQVAKLSADRDHLPWGILLLFPLAFHQFYFFGFVNYLLSLPLLFLALNDLQRFSQEPVGWYSWLRQFVLLALLFLTHNYTVQVYIVLGTAWAWYAWSRSPHRLTLVPPLAMACVFGTWTVLNIDDITEGIGPWVIWWWRGENLGPFLLLPFTGLRWVDGVDWWSLVSWLVIVGVVVVGWQISSVRNRPPILWLALALLGYAVMPYWFGRYAFFNLRMASVIYFLLAWLVAQQPLGRRSGMIIVLACLVLLVRSGMIQKQVSEEKESILPIVQAMSPNALILPIIFDSSPKAIDRMYFYQLHEHDPFYYHVLVGGGGNPALFDNRLMAIRYRSGIHLPQYDVKNFSWLGQDIPYDYIITRNLPEEGRDDFARHVTLIRQSGPWALYGTKTPR